jgi:magnesium-protoporphyrin IX monomethyl ester (oxidative) cyclase
VGGIHISSLPQSLPRNCIAGVIGEGENTVLDLIKHFMNDRFKKDSLRKINGIIFRDDSGQIVKTPERELIDNMDEIPFPARGLLSIQRNGFLHLFSSRGCKYRCAFCSNSRFWKKVRFFSANYIFEEIKEIMAKYYPLAITFYDDDFLINKERLKNLVTLIEKAGINKKVEFNLMTTVGSIDEEVIRLLKKMNVSLVSLGLESGCQKTLDFLKCGTNTVQDNMSAIELLNKAGILTYGFFIIGSPHETEEDILETLRFINISPLSGFSLYTLVPYPGTPIWEYAKQRNLVSDSMSWDKLALNIHEARNEVVILSEKISKEKLYELYWRFQRLSKLKNFSLRFKRATRHPRLIIPRIGRILSYYSHTITGRLSYD